MARRFKFGIKICLSLILLILIPLLILIGYNSCGLGPSFQVDSLDRDYASLKDDPIQLPGSLSQPSGDPSQPSGDPSQPSGDPSQPPVNPPSQPPANPPLQPPVNPPPQPPFNPILDGVSFRINNGALVTNNLNVTLNFTDSEGYGGNQNLDFKMKIANGGSCNGGNWESYKPTRRWSLSSSLGLEEGGRSVSVRFKTIERSSGIIRMSGCLEASITYDNMRPRNLVLTSSPAKRTNQKRAVFRYEAEDYTKLRFECKIVYSTNGGASWQAYGNRSQWHRCSSASSASYASSAVYGRPSLYFRDGYQKFSVRAIDLAGNTSSPLDYEWEINSEIPTIVFPDVSDSPCAARNQYESNTPVNAIPIQLNLTNRNPGIPHPFSVECKKSDGSFEECGNINASDSNAILEVTDDYFTTTSLTASSGYSQRLGLPQSVINNYSDTIYYKEHKIEVKASDDFGNHTSSRICTWRTLPQKSEFRFSHTGTFQKKPVDILFVIDHSRSMQSIARQFSESFKGLISSLSGFNWRIAVISTQSGGGGPYYFGEFLSIHSSQCSTPFSRARATDKYILAPFSSCSGPFYCSENIGDLQNAFINTIKCPSFETSVHSRVATQLSIQAAYEILNHYQENKGYTGTHNLSRAYAQFFRERATLVMIFLTDTPNCGQRRNNATTNDLSLCNTTPINSTNCSDFGERSRSDFPADLVQKVRCAFGENKRFFAYPIIPTTFSDTEHYVELAKRTQGRIPDWTKPLIRIDDRRTGLTTGNREGKYTRGLRQIKRDIDGRTIHLKCKPSDEVPASGGRLRVPGPIYLFKPHGETTFQRIIPPPISTVRVQGPMNPYGGNSMVITEGGDRRHFMEVIKYWKNIDLSGGSGQGLNKVRFTTNGYYSGYISNTPRSSVATTILPAGTYRVEYVCPDS